MRLLYTLLFALVLFFFSANWLNGQCYIPQLRENRLAESTLVITGRIVDSEPFYNSYGHIDTRHEVEVYSTWFGDTSLATVDMVTLGGTINEEKTVVRPSLYVQKGDLGVFMLKRPRGAIYGPYGLSGESPLDWKPVAAHESMMAIDTILGKAYDQDFTFATIADLEAFLQNFFQRRPHIRREITALNQPTTGNGRSAIAISGFQPTTATAGTGDLISIRGSGFGNEPGAVLFDSPDDGRGGAFISIPPAAIRSWADGEIEVELTGQVGSGRIQVRNASNETAISANSLNIRFGVTSLELSNGTFVNARLVDDAADGNGGYTYLLSDNGDNNGQSLVDNPQALAALGRAIDTWQEDGGYAFYAGLDCGTTSVQRPVQGDGINVISFGSDAYDFDRERGRGTVGIAFSYYSRCGSSQFELVGGDILFRRDGNGVSYDYGSGSGSSSTTSFEAVALHEIGHTHQLTHVSDPTQIMNYRVLSGQAITGLSNDDVSAAAFVGNLALAYNPPVINCGGDYNRERDYTTYSANADCASAVLPVELLRFAAEKKGRSAALSWVTATERDNEGFIIERSVDGRLFREIGRMPGAGDSDQPIQYDFLDESPTAGMNYYRLVQRDYDGTITPSGVVSLDFKVSGPDDFSSAPNPFADELTVRVNNGSTNRLFGLYNARGQRVKTFQIPDGESFLRLPVNTLPAGAYWLKRNDGSVQQLIKR